MAATPTRIRTVRRHLLRLQFPDVTSCSYSRAAPLLPPSLTISYFPHPPQPDKHPILSYILAELLQQYVSIPLSLELLNSKTFAPESREEDLHAGYLQLPAGTTVLLTESAVREGVVSEKGEL